MLEDIGDISLYESKLKVLVDLLGWLYVIFWSIAYYPPILLNFKIKSSESLSLDSILLNLTGYHCYFFSVYLLTCNETVKVQYSNFHGINSKPLLNYIDLVYVSHGLLLNYLTFVQVIYYKFQRNRTHYHKNDMKNIKSILLRAHKSTKVIISIIGIFVIVLMNQIFINKSILLISLTTYLTYIKLFLNLIKHIPQIVLNSRKKNMKGFSLIMICLDVSGAICCLSQLTVNNFLSNIKGMHEHDHSLNHSQMEIDFIDIICKNVGKFCLSFIALTVDICYLIQKRMYSQAISNDILEQKLPTITLSDYQVSKHHINMVKKRDLLI
ncbi:cystinosin-like protein ERS1 [Ascoidea rubescens DSM 1968]|uniref:PQ-loop-domain-containing protein n=1 Tax=Ascoidea rubescens DSM 1968 TaxID=1344418 RepID=A0A1D2VSG1_9ASCO|nr:PQ-loop-domain-containing protein [Ascoidea rubescens DSM 1968]ODV64518.1 PQ-loop-domain-containing protein [Ascoidea rubescens DSM 1968]